MLFRPINWMSIYLHCEQCHIYNVSVTFKYKKISIYCINHNFIQIYHDDPDKYSEIFTQHDKSRMLLKMYNYSRYVRI